MAAVRRFVAWPFWGLLLLSAVLVVVQTRATQPVLILLGLVMMAGVVLLADPWRVAGLVLGIVVLALVEPLLAPSLPGYWARFAWLPLFGVLSVLLARVERSRIGRARETSRLLQEVIDATDQPVFAKRFGGAPGEGATYVLTNSAWRHAVGAPDPAPAVLRDVDVFGPEAAALISTDEAQVLSSGRPVTFEQRLQLKEGERRTYLTTMFPLFDDDGATTGLGGIATDVTDRERAEQRLTAVFAHSPVPTLRLVTGGARRTVVLDANEAVGALLARDVVGAGTADIAALVHPDDLADTWALFDRVVEDAGSDGGAGDRATLLGREVRLRDGSGGVVWVILSVSPVGQPQPDGEQELIVQFEDITARKHAETALTEKALTDSVTGLPNRYALSDRLTTALARLARHPGLVCVMFCDLDRFKQVNDVFGHATGDLLLQEVARRLSGAVRPEDTVGRQGGDEFVVVCEGMSDPRDAVLLASRLQDRLRERWSVGGHDFDPTTSIGIAFTEDPACDPGDLLRQADVAMYRAKDSGRDRIELYDRSLDDELADALSMQQKLRGALADGGFVLHHQPVVLLDSMRVVGAESLLRMRDGDALLPPGVFLQHAESSGLIGAVGEWVLQRALSELKGWSVGSVPSSIGVNVSPTQLLRPGFARSVLDTLGAHGVETRRLVLEVTETALMSEERTASETLHELHESGLLIALDDFGTGYSSLSWLHQLPVDIVKIDKSFVQTMAVDHRRAVVVRAIIDIADEIGIGVVAEGIETEQQLEMLLELGCEAGQGYLLGRPAPAGDPSWAARVDPSPSWHEVRGAATRRAASGA